jgi:hypothetical protein
VIFGDRVAKTKPIKQLTLVTLQTARSWIDLAENPVNTTESRFDAGLNRLLQQNRGQSGLGFPALSLQCRFCDPLGRTSQRRRRLQDRHQIALVAARGCHLCPRYDLLPMSPGWTMISMVSAEGLEPSTP